MSVVVVHLLIAIGLLGASLWWYRRHIGSGSMRPGWLLWVVWLAFGALSLVFFTAIGPAMVFGGLTTWIFCVAGTVLGSRLLARASRRYEEDFWGLATLFAAGTALLVFVMVWAALQSAILNTN